MKGLTNIIFLLFLVSFSNYGLAQSADAEVDSLSNNVDIHGPELYNGIVPDASKNYVYFEVRGDRGYEIKKLITSIGDKPKKFRIPKLESDRFGFFECEDVLCSTYIIAISQDNSIEIIDTEELLIQFLGSIDNEEESILLQKANEYLTARKK
ncbi:MAG: hypothetical protein RLO81_11500 [Fulvivirga sp.]|uniref:hypothetical protein n=1 Tax=Fulvivirga sp. TaxID=1931237 RepID=UPI0032ED6354